MEQTLVFVKPDAVVRRYTGARILSQLAQHGEVTHYEVVAPGEDFLAHEHYAEHEGRFFYEWLIDYVSTSPVHVLVLEGDDLVGEIRERLGDTVPNEAAPTSLRGRYGIYGGLNTTHASDSPENGEREVELWQSVLDDGLDSHEERLAEYVDQYLDYPQIDPVRYREVTRRYVEGELDEKAVRSAFTTLLARESDASSSTIEALSDVMVANAELER